MIRPIVTAFITVYNEEQRIVQAVRSLLDQTLREIEVLVIDDGSSDGTRFALESIKDTRLRVIIQGRRGRASSLAFACGEAKGLYLANLDADDIAFPNRLAKQAAFLNANPDHAWVGCGEEREDSQRGERLSRLYPSSDTEIRHQSAKCIPYCHSGIMFHKSLIDEGINYDPLQPFLIDFEFFLRVAKRHKVANLSEVLVKRYVRNESYFQSRFNTGQQNRRLACLCAHAVRELRLPLYYYIFPAVRLAYPLLPNPVKRFFRKHQGLKETHE